MGHYMRQMSESFRQSLDSQDTHIYMHTIVSYTANEFLKTTEASAIESMPDKSCWKTMLDSVEQLASFLETRGPMCPDIGRLDWQEDSQAFYFMASETFMDLSTIVEQDFPNSLWPKILKTVVNQIAPYRRALEQELKDYEMPRVKDMGEMHLPLHAIFNPRSVLPSIAADIQMLYFTTEREIRLARSDEKIEVLADLRGALNQFSRVNFRKASLNKAHRLSEDTLAMKFDESQAVLRYASDTYEKQRNMEMAFVCDSMGAWINSLSEIDEEFEVNRSKPSDPPALVRQSRGSNVLDVEFRQK